MLNMHKSTQRERTRGLEEWQGAEMWAEAGDPQEAEEQQEWGAGSRSGGGGRRVRFCRQQRLKSWKSCRLV